VTPADDMAPRSRQDRAWRRRSRPLPWPGARASGSLAEPVELRRHRHRRRRPDPGARRRGVRDLRGRDAGSWAWQWGTAWPAPLATPRGGRAARRDRRRQQACRRATGRSTTATGTTRGNSPPSIPYTSLPPPPGTCGPTSKPGTTRRPLGYAASAAHQCRWSTAAGGVLRGHARPGPDDVGRRHRAGGVPVAGAGCKPGAGTHGAHRRPWGWPGSPSRGTRPWYAATGRPTGCI
jgi:hypothetical protein